MTRIDNPKFRLSASVLAQAVSSLILYCKHPGDAEDKERAATLTANLTDVIGMCLVYVAEGSPVIIESAVQAIHDVALRHAEDVDRISHLVGGTLAVMEQEQEDEYARLARGKDQ